MNRYHLFFFYLLLTTSFSYGSDSDICPISSSSDSDSASKSAEMMFEHNCPLPKVFRTIKLPSRDAIHPAPAIDGQETEPIDPFQSRSNSCIRFFAATCRLFARCCQ